MTMTQYSDDVEKQKLKLEAEEWGKQIKYYHFNNGIRTIEYNNGYKMIHDTVNDKVRVERYQGKKSLLDRFLKSLGDSWN
mgnify:FL=1|tara:strand:- start:324 stop:563 length:240 start_codon:yes stop_codon:yes gene_type:complete